MNPDRPVLRGTAQNPDVYFQARETVNPFYDACPGIVQRAMDRFAALTGRQYHLFDYFGAPDAERVVVLMGSGALAAEECVEALLRQGRKGGRRERASVPAVFRGSFCRRAAATVRAIAVLDRTKEPGSAGEPLYQDVHRLATCKKLGRGWKFCAASARDWRPLRLGQQRVHAGHGRGSIRANSQHPSLATISWSASTTTSRTAASITTLGSPPKTRKPCAPSSTVWERTARSGANKNSIKIIGEDTGQLRAGIFRLRLQEIRRDDHFASALRAQTHPRQLSYRSRQLRGLPSVLLSGTHGRSAIWRSPARRFCSTARLARTRCGIICRNPCSARFIEKQLRFYVIDAYRVAKDNGMGGRINTVMQTCFFALSGVLPREEAITAIKHAIEKTYGKRGEAVVEKNFAAVDNSLANLSKCGFRKR